MSVTQAQLENARAWQRRGAFAEAERLYQSILLAEPRNVAALHGLGMLHLQQRNAEKAEPLLARAVELAPGNPGVWHDWGIALRALGRFQQALASFDRAAALNPDAAAIHYNRGIVLLRLGDNDAAVASFTAAISRDPKFFAAYNERANALRALNRLDDAIADYDAAAAISPDHPAILCNRGFALQDLGRFDEALQAYNRAVALKPDYALAYQSRGSLKLLLGQMREGFADFEWRLRSPASAVEPPLQAIPRWKGEGLRGKSILIHSDGAFGDLVQFSRYLSFLTEKGGQVSLLTPAKFHRILAMESFGIQSVSIFEEAGAVDFRCELMSLPLLFTTELETIPPIVPHLACDAGNAERWRKRLPADTFNIGICWQGNPERHIDRGRSIPLAEFAPLAHIPGVRLFSLQKHHGLEQLQVLPPGTEIESFADLDEGPDAFVDTAALMQSLELIVTSDTAVAHLAAALGRPAWIALRYVPEWRWLLGRSDSPWYPSVRLFRQNQMDRWGGVFEEIAAAVSQLVASCPHNPR